MKLFHKILFWLGLGTAACSASSLEVGTKEVADPRGIVQLTIPENWVEELEPDGNVMFYGADANAGTLRLTVITATSPTDVGRDETVNLVKGITGVDPTTIKRLSNGNAVGRSVVHTSENGTPITMFWWYVTNAVPPEHVRIANFSYTVLTADEDIDKTVADLKMLDQSIRRAEFNPDLGHFGQ